MRTLIAPLALLALTTGAQAICVTVPDDASSGYSARGLEKTICLQDEIDYSARERALRTEYDQSISKLQRDMLQQKFQFQRLNTLPWQTNPWVLP